MRYTRVIAASAAGLGLTVGLLAAAAPAAPAGTERPPECHLVQIVMPHGSAWMQACGGAGGQESWVQDFKANTPVIEDGTQGITPGELPQGHAVCGPGREQPAVVKVTETYVASVGGALVGFIQIFFAQTVFHGHPTGLEQYGILVLLPAVAGGVTAYFTRRKAKDASPAAPAAPAAPAD